MAPSRTRRNSLTVEPAAQEEFDFFDQVGVPVIKGDLDDIPRRVKNFIAENVQLCRPKGIYLCDGSQEEAEEITEKMVERGLLTKLDKLDNW